MDRREFLAKAGLVATWAAVSVKIIGCSDDESNPVGGGGPGDVNGDVSVSSGHSHPVTITAAQISAGNAVTLTLRTSSGHTHSVDLTAEEVMDIGAGTAVVENSTNDSGHFHVVQFN